MKDPLGIMGAETIFTMEIITQMLSKRLKTWKSSRLVWFTRLIPCLITLMELEQSCTDHTSTTTGEIFHGFHLYLTYN